jgi:hypothetical protein
VGIGAEHEGHLRHQRQGQRGGNPEAAHFVLIERELLRLFVGARVGGGHIGGETGLDDGGNQPADVDLARRVAHVGALGGEVHRRLDAGQLVELLLDARRAGRAGHAAQRQLDGVAFAFGGVCQRAHAVFGSEH